MPPERCRAVIRRDRRHLYAHFNGVPDLLFDLQADPQELHDIAGDEDSRRLRLELQAKILDWLMETQDPHPQRWNSGWPLRDNGGVPLKGSVYDVSEL